MCLCGHSASATRAHTQVVVRDPTNQEKAVFALLRTDGRTNQTASGSVRLSAVYAAVACLKASSSTVPERHSAALDTRYDVSLFGEGSVLAGQIDKPTKTCKRQRQRGPPCAYVHVYVRPPKGVDATVEHHESLDDIITCTPTTKQCHNTPAKTHTHTGHSLRHSLTNSLTHSLTCTHVSTH